MFLSKPKGWISSNIWKPKNPHSLEHLKYLYNVLSRNQVVNEGNRTLLVETLRQIAEILIWGDQNDSTVFDFFLEKNMLGFVLKIMRQKSGRYVCVQLLQTLNILFENIRNETSLYYLLSNNHINSIIVHKFDFSDEEIMAYYISFLKTLSLKLNTHTIHFFYNEHTNDFPLYTEAIKFFNHSEIMVRNAVRTLTLNVYRVDDKSMLKFIKDRTAAPYFFNLVWFVGSHIIELDMCVRNDADHNSRTRLSDLVAEHLDHLHYVNDILSLGIESLNNVLVDHLLNRLLIPLYVYSLTKRRKYSAHLDEKPHVNSVVSLFLLSQVFLITRYAPLVRQLADIIFNGDIFDANSDSQHPEGRAIPIRRFTAPPETLAQSLESNMHQLEQELLQNEERDKLQESATENDALQSDNATTEQTAIADDTLSANDQGALAGPSTYEINQLNCTDEEKAHHIQEEQHAAEQAQQQFSLTNRPYLEAIFNSLDCAENDYEALFALCLLYAIGHNDGINEELLDSVLMPTDRSLLKYMYNIHLVERLIKVITLSCQHGSKVRLATLELATLVLKQLVYKEDSPSFLQDGHLAWVEAAREESILLLRNFYKGEEIFLDMFEDEYQQLKLSPLNVEYLTMDHNILLTPTGTPMTGIEFTKRLPCGDVERARRAIRVFFLLRDLSLTLRHEPETQLPLTKLNRIIKVDDVLDLNNSDLIACTVLMSDGQKLRRFLAIDLVQMILVEPDTKRLGWGVARFVGFLQDIEVSGDRTDSRVLHITIHKQNASRYNRGTPLLSAKFAFDDHIRSMAAKQRLTKGRMKARQHKMQCIARLLELPGASQSFHPGSLNSGHQSRRRTSTPGGQATSSKPSKAHPTSPRNAAAPTHLPTVGVSGRKEHSERVPKPSARHSATVQSEKEKSRSRDTSPQIFGPSEEMIPLEDFSKKRHRSEASGSGSRGQSSSPEDGKSRRSSSASPRGCVRRPSGPLPRVTQRASTSQSPARSRPRLVRQDSGPKRHEFSVGPKLASSHRVKESAHSRSSSEPKSLTPATAPTVSLTDAVDDLKISTTILPPTNQEQIRHLVTDSSSEDDLTTETSFTEAKPRERSVSDLFDRAEVVSSTDALSPSNTMIGEITKLAQMVQQQFSTSEEHVSSASPSPTKSKQTSNIESL